MDSQETETAWPQTDMQRLNLLGKDFVRVLRRWQRSIEEGNGPFPVPTASFGHGRHGEPSLSTVLLVFVTAGDLAMQTQSID